MSTKVTLYIATHNETGKKYFGKTTRYFNEDDLQKYYHGSGKSWGLHLKEFGNDVTMKIYGIYDIEDVENKALLFSLLNDITNSEDWLNEKPENGLDGGSTPEMIERMVETRKKNNSYKTGGLKQSKTLNKVQKNGKTIAQERNEQSAKTMKEKGIYEMTAVKISKVRKEKGLSKGKNNCKAKRIGIFNDRDELVFVSHGNFFEMCEENNLPAGAFKKSRLKGTKLYETEESFKCAHKENKKFRGWYSRDLKDSE